MKFLRPTFAASVLTAGLLALSTGNAAAQTAQAPSGVGGLTIQAVASEKGSWNSNPLMLTTGKVTPLTGSTTTPELIIQDTTPLSKITSDTRLDQNIFDQSAFDSTDVHESAGLSTMNEHWTAGVNAHTDYDTTRTSELTNYGLATGVTRHLGLGAGPQISYSPSALDTYAIGGSLNSSQYDSSAFTNYETFNIAPSYTRHLDALNAAVLQVQAQRYQTTRGPAVRVDTLGPSVGWQTSLSPRFTANVNVGAQTTRQYDLGVATGPWKWDYTFSAGLAFKGTQDNINLSAVRDEFPYADGQEALQTTFSANESHELNSLFAVNIGGTYLTSTYQTFSPGTIDTLTGGNGGLTYHATEHIDLTATYQYRYETLTASSRTARDNAVTLALVFRPDQWTPLR